jgi:aldose 1-epimerase
MSEGGRSGSAGAGQAPSGRQVELVSGDQRAVVTEVGGSLRTYTVGSVDVLDGYGPHEMSSGGRGQLLIPWPNRIRDGRYRFGGADHQTPLSEPEHGNAIHGLVRWANWALTRSDEARAVASHVLHPQTGYPFTLGLEVEYALSAAGLRVAVTASNLGSEALPYGAGQHPYFTVHSGLVDEALLEVPSGSVLEADERGIPTGRTLDVTGGDRDYRRRRPIGPTVLDACYSGLDRDGTGTARVVLGRPGGEGGLTIWTDASFDFVMVFTGDTLAPDRRRRGLAVEPMTCAPDAFRNGIGLQVIEPGGRSTAAWGVSPW